MKKIITDLLKSIVGKIVFVVALLVIFFFICGKPSCNRSGISLFASLGGLIPHFSLNDITNLLPDPTIIIDDVMEPDTIAVIEDIESLPTNPVHGGIISENEMQIVVVDPVLNIGHILQFNMPHHGSFHWEFSPSGELIAYKDRFGFEFNGTLGSSLRGPVGTIELLFANDVFDLDDFNLHAAVSLESNYNDFKDLYVGIGIDVDLFPDHTNLRFGIHPMRALENFPEKGHISFMLSTEIFSFD
jgi:hypothetical protein